MYFDQMINEKYSEVEFYPILPQFHDWLLVLGRLLIVFINFVNPLRNATSISIFITQK